MMRSKRSAGLTLIELLVALVIMSILGLMSWRGIDSALTARDSIRTVEQRWQKLSRGYSLIEHNLLQAAERGSNDLNALPDFKLEKLENGEQRLIFWRMDPVQGSRLTGFRMDDDQLMLLRWPHNVPVQTAADNINAESIMQGVRNIRWAVLAPNKQWQDVWPPSGQGNSAGLPLGIRIDMDIDNVGHIQRIFAFR